MLLVECPKKQSAQASNDSTEYKSGALRCDETTTSGFPLVVIYRRRSCLAQREPTAIRALTPNSCGGVVLMPR